MSTLFLTKLPKKHKIEKKTTSSTSVAGKSGYLSDPCCHPVLNINSKWIKDLNIRPKTLQLVQARVGNTLEAIGIGKDFFSRTPAAQQLRERMDKWTT
jgi:hypothetical protein